MRWLLRTPQPRGGFHVLTFYTEGPPHDAGRSLVEVEREFRALVEPHTDSYLAYSPSRLAAEGEATRILAADYRGWLLRHSRAHELGTYNEAWASIGFLRWKPFLLLRLMESEHVASGDVVLYHDVDFTRYPSYSQHIEEWRALSFAVLNAIGADVYASPALEMRRDVKAWLIRRYLDDSYRTERGLWGGLVVARKSERAIAFLRDWWELSSDLDNVSPLPNPEPYPDAIWHAGEQAVLSVTAALWRAAGRLSSDWPVYTLEHRAFGFDRVRLASGRIAGIRSFLRGLRVWLA